MLAVTYLVNDMMPDKCSTACIVFFSLGLTFLGLEAMQIFKIYLSRSPFAKVGSVFHIMMMSMILSCVGVVHQCAEKENWAGSETLPAFIQGKWPGKWPPRALAPNAPRTEKQKKLMGIRKVNGGTSFLTVKEGDLGNESLR